MPVSLTRFLIFIFFFLLLCSAFSCSGGKRLKATHLEGTEQFSGLFHVILYGRKHHDDLLTVAFLDRADDDYELVPHEPPFEYTVERNIRGNAALEKATHFVSYHPTFQYSRSRKIWISMTV